MCPRFVTTLEYFLISPSMSIRDAIASIDKNSEGIALVTDDGNRLIRTVTDGDIRRAMLAKLALDDTIGTLLRSQITPVDSKPITAPFDTSDASILRLMNELKIRHVPLVDEHNRVVDIALLRHLVRDYEPGLEAIVMAGGFGTRLHPLTEETPKPMLPVGGRPLMEYTIKQLRNVGIKKVNIATHFRPDKIIDHFGDGSDIGVDLNYVNEMSPLGTAGALGLVEEWRGTLLMINGDILTNVDFNAMHRFHQEHQAILTVAVRQYDLQIPYGVIESNDSFVVDITEKPEAKFLVNAGIYLIEPSARTHLPKEERFDMTDLIKKLIADGQPVACFPIREYWLDIGQHDDYIRAQEDAKNGRV
ncbi:MAG: nucleotidyltransferase family protein [Rhodospirillales bacterium]